jgi:hypothetical protein
MGSEGDTLVSALGMVKVKMVTDRRAVGFHTEFAFKTAASGGRA